MQHLNVPCPWVSGVHFRADTLIFSCLYGFPATDFYVAGGGTLLPDTPPQSSNSLDNELKVAYGTGSISPSRLSPNIFLNLNIDHLGLERGGSGLSMEWSTYPPSTSSTQPSEQVTHTPQQPLPQHQQEHQQQHHQQQVCTLDAVQHQALASAFGASLDLDMNDGSSAYDEMKFLSVDQFTIDSFKADCILSMEHALALDDKSSTLTHATSSAYEAHNHVQNLVTDNSALHSLCLDGIGVGSMGLTSTFSSLSMLSTHVTDTETEPKSPPSLLVLDKTLPSLNIGVDGIGDLVDQLHQHHHDVGVGGSGDVV